MKRVLLAFLVMVAGCRKAGATEWTRPPVIDVHGHLDPSAFARIGRIMDRSGIEVLVNLSGGSWPEEIAASEALSKALGGRILNFYNPDWDDRDEPWWGDREAQRLEDAVLHHGFRGLKIAKALGLYLRDGAKVLIDVDDPRLDPLWEAAGMLGVPVAIHVGDPKAFWKPATPDNERYEELAVHPGWSFYGEPVPTQEALIEALERVIDRHPETTFICVHFGNDPEDPDYVARLLERYPNAFVDIAARVPELGRQEAGRMHDLFVRFQDRIVFGTDIGIGRFGLMLGSSGNDEPGEDDAARFYATTFRWLETADRQFDHPTPIQGRWKIDGIALPPEVLEKIYRTNALRLLTR